jgi:ABC-type multidrug transport system permease subunit
MNPAEFFIEEIHEESNEKVDSLPLFIESYNLNLLPEIDKEINDSNSKEIVLRESTVSITTTFGELLRRDVINIFRNPMIFKSRVFQSIFLAVYIGGLYFNAGKQDYTDTIAWQTIVGYFFFQAIGNMMASLTPVSLIFPQEREVFLKEENSRLYGVAPYFISRNLVEIPYLIVFPLLFNVIIYWMVGQASTA